MGPKAIERYRSPRSETIKKNRFLKNFHEDPPVQGLKVWEHDFEIISDPKGLKRRPTFWLGFKAPDP